MRVFPDACIDPQVATVLVGHDVRTAFEMGWYRLKGSSPDTSRARCIRRSCEMDRGFEYEHNLKKLQVGIVIVHVPKNKIEFYRPLAADLLAAIATVEPGAVVHVPSRDRGYRG